jgi:hypothetical protein
MSLDTPDEPWLASLATNLADNGNFSPSFIGSPYGSPDPALSRYYVLMGLLVKVIGSSLPALRLLSLLLAFCALAIVAHLLWTEASLSTAQRLMGVIVLLCMSAFLRMSHNIRSDIGLAVYAAVILLGLRRTFSDGQHAWRWLVLMGLALYPGMEAIPFGAVILGGVVGGALLLHGWRGKQLRVTVKNAGLYAAGCGIALALYAASHFLLPSVSAATAGFQKFSAYYARGNAVGLVRNPLNDVVNYHIRFSLILSPLEIIVAIGVLILLWRKGGKSERWILGVFGITACLMLVFTDVAYGYWALFTPLIAYAAAKALDNKRLILFGVVVLIPALAAPPIYDLSQAVLSRNNQTRLAETDSFIALFPDHTVMIADDLFWYTLHPNRTVIGLAGIRVYVGANHVDYEQAVKDLQVQALLCEENDAVCQKLVATGLFSEPERKPLGDKTYLIYWR